MAYYNPMQYSYQPYTPPMADQLSQLRGYQTAQPRVMQGQEQPPMIWVQGETGAKAHMVAPGNTVVLWDSENPLIYIKTADASGMPSMRIFEWTEKTAPSPSVMQGTAQQYVTVEEYSKLAAMVNELNTKISQMNAKENSNAESLI